MKVLKFLVGFLLCVQVQMLFAQISTASIVGTVLDSTGAAVSGATVTATQVDTHVSRTVSTSSDGLYNFPLLPLGPYSLKVSVAGFGEFQQKGIVLTVGQVANIPISLRPGNVSETVTVSGNATMLNTTGSESSQLIEQAAVEGVPLNGRNPASLLFLTGGVNNPIQNIPSTNTGSPILQNALVYPTESAATIHGVRGGGVYFSLDGANNLDPYQVTGGPFPNPDMTSEFSVVSGNYGARYVSAPGGAVNIVTRSGTNKIHGDAFEFVRNGAVNARNFFATVVDPLKRNQFGGDLGAPILHDRWFVFGGYQGTRLSDIAGGNVAFVPNTQQRAGNLSNVTTPIKDPTTGQPFPSNSSIGPLDPVIQKLLAYVPLPTNTANGSVTYDLPKVNTEESVVGKTDFVHGAHRIFGRYFYDNFNWPATGIPNHNLLSTFRGQKHQWHNATVGYTWVRGNFVSDARFSFIRDNSQNVAGETSVTLPGLGAKFTEGQFPTIQLVQTIGLFNIAAGNYNGFVRNTWDGAEDITILRGRHQISLGAEVQRIGNKIVTDNQQNAIPVFTGAATGNVMADLILGMSSVTLQSDGSYIQAGGVLPGFYGEDKIRINDRFTVTAGLRWDPYWPFHAQGGRISCYIPGAPQSKVFTNAPSGLVFPGDPNCNSSGFNSNNLGNVQPRLGFALKLDSAGKTVVRGGYGIYTMQFPMASFLSFGSAQPFERLLRVSTPVSVSNPWATFPGGNPFANGFQLDDKPRPANSTFLTPSIAYSMAQNFRLGYVQQWSLIAERSLTDNDFVSIAYYGTVGRHLSLVQDGNQAVYVPGNSTISNVQARRPNPNVAAVNTEVSSGKSNYNGLEVVYRHRVRGGITLSTNFDWGKSLDNASSPANVGLTTGSLIPVPNNPSLRYGPSDFDQRHTLRTIATWNLPWFSSGAGIKKAALGGWQVSGLLTWDSGFPFSVTSSLNQSFTSNGTDLADRVPGVSTSLSGNRSEQAKIAQYFNAAAFTVNAPGTFGNSGRNGLTSPSYVNVDGSVVKGFQIRESMKVILRVEGFNVLNHTQFLPPVGAYGATLGKLTGARDPRVLQGAVKLVF